MKVLLFANTDWYLYNFRLSLARAIRDAGHDLLLVSPGGPFGERLRGLGFRWEPAPMDRRSLNPLRELALLRWLRHLVLHERPDIVHSFTIKCAIYGSLAARVATFSDCTPRRVNAVAGMGYVFTSNSLKARLLRPVVRLLFRLALGGSDARLVVQNPDDSALFIAARMVHPTTVRTIPGSGVDCQRFSPGNTRERRTEMRVLLPARLLWDKGIAEFARAARVLRGEGRPIEFLLAGNPDPGNPAAVPEGNVRQWVNEGVLTWLGHVEDMPTLLRTVDVVTLPSYREGLPKGLIEAAACGLPLITTDAPGCREVVQDGVNGLLIPVRSDRALADAIARLQDDPPLARRLGAAARAAALSRFNDPIIIAQTLAVYSELLDPSKAGAE